MLSMARKSFVVLSLLALFSCSPGRRIDEGKSDGSIPFIEFYSITEGKVISGNPPQGKRIDSPGYSYNPELQELQIYRNKPENLARVKLLLGAGKVLKGVSGQGVSSFIVPVDTIPFTYSDLVILSSTSKGVSCLLKGKRITLKKNMEVTFTDSKTDTLSNSSIIQTTHLLKLKFSGFVKKVN